MKYFFGFVLLVVCLTHAANAADADVTTAAPTKKKSMAPNLLAPIADVISNVGGGISFVATAITPDFVTVITDQLGIVGVIIRWALVPIFAILWPVEYVLFWVLYLVGLTRVNPNEALLGIRY